MKNLAHFLLGLLVVADNYGVDAFTKVPVSIHYGIHKLNRSSFPKYFIFGAASSAYQYEGAWNLDGKGPSNWDNFTHKFPEKIADHTNGDVATDSYHLYREDVKLLKDMNMDSYRFSISWTRVIPSGKLSGGVNEKGTEYYNNLINNLLAVGLEPMVTLFHWDTPQALEDEYGGFLSPKIINDYHDYVNLCFERFGDRVKKWITFNEPSMYSIFGYDIGFWAPGRCSAWRSNNCTGGDSGTEPYMVAHHQLLAHADAVELYRIKYQATQKGIIGITLVTLWFVPLTKSTLDEQATIRALDFKLGWFMNPLVYGNYPTSMQALMGDRLPKLTQEQSEKLKGSFEFLGLNYYTAEFTGQMLTAPPRVNLSYSTDDRVNHTARNLEGRLIGKQAGSSWIYVYPKGLRELLIYVKNKYQNPIIYITENGVSDVNDPNLQLEVALKDSFRVKFYFRHLKFLHKAIEDGVRVQGFYAWSLLDNFEWSAGYTVRFGINYVDFKTLKRHRKISSYWFERFLKK